MARLTITENLDGASDRTLSAVGDREGRCEDCRKWRSLIRFVAVDANGVMDESVEALKCLSCVLEGHNQLHIVKIED